MSGLSLRDGVRSFDVLRELGVDRCILASKLSRFRHLFRMLYQTHSQLDQSSRLGLELTRGVYMPWLALEHLGVPRRS